MTDFFKSLDRSVQRIQEGLDRARDVLEAVDDLASPAPAVIDVEWLTRRYEWSQATFGPGKRTKGVLEHIRKELVEIEEDPSDLEEWIDLINLALDGAGRAGHIPQAIIDMLIAKQIKNEGRTWPDWTTASEDEAIEHVRD